ncbi:hypothetical protein CVIRNUC_008195 [Coccomyxa viridis]|uniref:Uncharacterized protein n=1 Tax=Coccomyxa viridis TaxID=1274662 RepID=A0AAV1IEW7_9CHLO|nr:hypothetical protein CVIRNUC_008195 [Coccomyxa viridis]
MEQIIWLVDLSSVAEGDRLERGVEYTKASRSAQSLAATLSFDFDDVQTSAFWKLSLPYLSLLYLPEVHEPMHSNYGMGMCAKLRWLHVCMGKHVLDTRCSLPKS